MRFAGSLLWGRGASLTLSLSLSCTCMAINDVAKFELIKPHTCLFLDYIIANAAIRCNYTWYKIEGILVVCMQMILLDLDELWHALTRIRDVSLSFAGIFCTPCCVHFVLR